MVGGMDLDVVFEEWLRSRVSAERPGVAPGSVTEGGYDTDVEGMRAWRSDCSEFLVWLAENEPEMFGEFRYRYMELDPEGWDALVGFGAGFHDKPAGPPDESQLESDLESLVDNPVVDGVPAVSAVLPPPPVEGSPGSSDSPREEGVPERVRTIPGDLPATPTSPTPAVPPRRIPVTPDLPPGLHPRMPGTWPVAPEYPFRPGGPDGGGSGRGPGRRRPHRPVPAGSPPAPPVKGPETRPHSPNAPFWPRRPPDWPWPPGPGHGEMREGDTTLNVGGNLEWGAPPGTAAASMQPPPAQGLPNFIGALVDSLFDLFDRGPVGGGPGPSGHPGQRDRGKDVTGLAESMGEFGGR